MIFLAEALNTTSEILDSLSPFQEYSFKRLQMTRSLTHYIISSYWNCVSGKMLGRLPLCGEAHKSPCSAKIQVQPCLNQPHRGSSSETWSSRGSNFIIMLLSPSPWSARNSNLDARKYNRYDKLFFQEHFLHNSFDKYNVVHSHWWAPRQCQAEHRNIAGQRGWRWVDKLCYYLGALNCLLSNQLNATVKMAKFTSRTGQGPFLLGFCHYNVEGCSKYTRTGNPHEVNPVRKQEVGICKLYPRLRCSSGLWNTVKDDEGSVLTRLQNLCWFIHKAEIIKQ